MSKDRTLWLVVLLVMSTIQFGTANRLTAQVSGELKQWHTVTLSWTGPESEESDDAANPFLDAVLTVEFEHASSGMKLVIPGFFSADGNAADSSATSGNVWQCRFSPPLTGKWNYRARLSQGKQVAIKTVPDAEQFALTRSTGQFSVKKSDKGGKDFRGQGALQYVGQRYLQFSGSGKYFLKSGTDSPETLLGYTDLDGTWHDKKSHPIPAPHRPIQLPSLQNGLHQYDPHRIDWKNGDPTWQSGKGKGLIGGINYLSQVGVNSMYFLTMNVNGDGRNVWPWTDPWEHTRFDCSKLDQWEIVFEHMQSNGIMMHVVLQETENDHLLDEGELGDSRKLYLREMIARFAHHPAIVWNLGEENTQTVDQQSAMAAYIRKLDAYDHPIVIHNDHWSPNNLRETFDPHLGQPALDGTALQDFNWNDVHEHTKHYVLASAESGKPWVVFCDEMGGANFGLKPDIQDPGHFNPRSKGLWGNLMAGGAGVEWYFGWQNNSPESDLSAESWRPRAEMWKQSRIAIDFFQKYLPFEKMRSADDQVLASRAYVFAQFGEVYCVYLPSGGNTRLDLESHDGPFSVRWFNPREGGEVKRGTVDHVWGPGLVNLGEPVSSSHVDAEKDWVALVRRVDPVFVSNEQGQIVIEAENAQPEFEGSGWIRLNKSGDYPDVKNAGPATKWVRSNLSHAAKASNRTFMRWLPKTTEQEESPIRFSLRIDDPGTYYVHLRIIDESQKDEAGWFWKSTSSDGSRLRAEFEEGENQFDLATKKFGLAVDKIILTKKEGDLFSGEGPSGRLVGLQPELHFPEQSFYRGTPESQGFDSEKLEAALSFLKSHCKEDGLSELMLVRNGVVFWEGDNTTKTHDIWSCTKSFTSTALGLLISEGKCDLDTLAANIEPKLSTLYPDARLRHFASMTSGYSANGRSRWNDENSDWSRTPYEPTTPHFAPGTAFAYWDEAMIMFGRILTRIAQQDLNSYLDQRVFEPIGMGTVEWASEEEVDGQPINFGATGIKINARQMARFGHLYLNQGRWKGEQIIPSSWVAAATTVQVPSTIPVGDTDRNNVLGSGAYGFNWWVNGGLSSMPLAPKKTYYASGLNHNVCVVVPEWNLVIVRMGVDGNPESGKHNVYNGFIGMLREAMLESKE